MSNFLVKLKTAAQSINLKTRRIPENNPKPSNTKIPSNGTPPMTGREKTAQERARREKSSRLRSNFMAERTLISAK